MTTSEAAEMLGCSMHLLECLIYAGLIIAEASNKESTRIYRLVARSDVVAFCERLSAMVPLDAPHNFLEPMNRVIKLVRRHSAEIISLVLKGELKRVSRPSPTLRIDEILVDAEAVRSLLSPQPRVPGYRNKKERRRDKAQFTFAEAAWFLGVAPATFAQLVERKHVPCLTSPRGTQWFEKPELEAFSSDHVSVAEVAEKYSMKPARLCKELAAKGVSPLLPGGRVKGNWLYTREAIATAGYP